MAKTFYDFSLNNIKGQPTAMADFKGKVALVVNVASKCGLTPQYEKLESLYRQYKAKGLVVLGFPANEFMGQEPGSNTEIEAFCRGTFAVDFPMFEKIAVKGAQQHPLYHFLTEQKPVARMVPGSKMEEKLEGHGQKRAKPNDILWNFEKFLIGRSGQVVERFAPDMTPDDEVIRSAVERALAT